MSLSSVGCRDIALKRQISDDTCIDSITYGAIGQMVKCICDCHPGVSIEVIEVNFPCPKSVVVKDTESLLKKYNGNAVPDHVGDSRAASKAEKRVKMVVVDAISSNPG